ncbi:zinc finger protein 184-like [Athalia rosae]|uniref:zinc finger protein 184-like n=1 Tax=Athalia rosae TaxID=37344 RepID=UPI0020337C8A|nr:zinc finger protein 184-like [Athalia rosae]
MACHALGRCRICARKHKIAVFGREEQQHFLIERANLKLIILNTVCISCISKIERFVKNMDLSSEYLNNQHDKKLPNSAEKLNYSLPIKMETDQKLSAQTEKHLIQFTQDSPEYSSTTTESQNDVLRTDNARSCCPRDSQLEITSPTGPLPQKKTCQTSVRAKSPEEPSRKRPLFIRKIQIFDNKKANNSNDLPVSLSSSKPAIIDDQDPQNSPSLLPASSSSADFSHARKTGRRLLCDFCKKEFNHTGDLNKHRRRHTGEKPYECSQCEQKFAHASNLARHQRVHSGERPFVCPTCGRSFTRRDKLTIHIAAAKCRVIEPNLNICRNKIEL